MPKWAAQHRSHAATRQTAATRLSRRYRAAGPRGPGLRSGKSRTASTLLWFSINVIFFAGGVARARNATFRKGPKYPPQIE
eukprot:3078299-Prymnesium_polylepis.3